MKRLKKELWIILLIISIVVCIGECGKAQIVIDTIDVSKMTKAQLRIVMRNYNKSLVLENDKLKIQVKAENPTPDLIATFKQTSTLEQILQTFGNL